ncbi:hypothetical protein ACFZBU_38995 [Embleya sp. NPDC008237]|uniref:hypothetical protein n=1 Tax=Embleya sp. NPDC008237 TaxID=3363978 RepID=UPI0036E7B750
MRKNARRDPVGAETTRNIGVVMEGACDREARAITRRAAARHDITARDCGDAIAFRDVTGPLDPADLSTILADSNPAATERDAYFVSLARYQANVNARYERFLTEIGRSEAEDLHALILTTVIGGDVSRLCEWLDRRHGPGTFTALFLSPGYLAPEAALLRDDFPAAG